MSDSKLWFTLAVALSFGCGADEPRVQLLRLNEISARSLEDPSSGEDVPDWVELKNISDAPVDAGDYYLTDDPQNLSKWRIPSTEVSDYLVIYLSGHQVGEAYGEVAPFGLDAEGDYLALVDTDGETIIDEIGVIPPQRYGVTYGIDEDDSDTVFRYFTQGTLGRFNEGDSFAGLTSTVQPSAGRGFYDADFELTLESDSDATIFYTLDGTRPGKETGLKYDGPLQVDRSQVVRTLAYRGGYLPSDHAAYTYVLTDDVLSQPESPAGFPSEWQPTSPADYAVDASVGSKDDLLASLRVYPSVSLSMPLDDWFNPDTDPTVGGIYSNSEIARGFDWERAVSAEFFDFNHGQEASVEAGIRVYGNASRSPTRGKHNMRLVFRKEYDVGKLSFPIFGDDEKAESINGYLLRGGNGDSWIHPRDWVREEALYLRDQFARTLHEQTGAVEVPQAHVNLYLNGLYWGLYHTIERIEASSMAATFGGEESEWDVVKSSRDGMQIVDGSLASWEAMQVLVTEAAQGERPLSDLETVLDLRSFADYLIVNFYGGNRDWDHNNFQAARRRTGGDTWRFFQWDSEHVLRSGSDDSTNINNIGRLTGIHHQLLLLPEYQAHFQSRVDHLLKGDGILTPAKAAATFETWTQGQEKALLIESARWGDHHTDGVPHTVVGDWQLEVQRMLEDYFPERTQTTLDQLSLQLDG